MRKIFFLQLVAIAYAAYSQQAQDDYDDYGGGGNGFGRPAPDSREPAQSHHQAAAPAPHGDDAGYDVAEEWKPYSFSYSAQDPEGSHSHQQQADSKNRVTGQYSIMMADGRMRIVKYVADENGFRADIVTNEQGTESKNPADVTIQSSAQTGEEAAKQHEDSYANSPYDNYDVAPGSRQTSPHSGGHGGAPPPATSYSNAQSYAKKDSQSFSQQNDHGYSQGHTNYQSNGYSTNSEYNQEYEGDQHRSAPTSSPASYPRPSGSYGNGISDIEEHEERGYYLGTGSRGAGAGRSKPSYGR